MRRRSKTWRTLYEPAAARQRRRPARGARHRPRGSRAAAPVDQRQQGHARQRRHDGREEPSARHADDHRPQGLAAEGGGRARGPGQRGRPAVQRRPHARRVTGARDLADEARSERSDQADSRQSHVGDRSQVHTADGDRDARDRSGAVGRFRQPPGHARAGGEPRRGDRVDLHHSGQDRDARWEADGRRREVGYEPRRFRPDGKMALVTRDGDERISVLSIDGTKVEYTKRDISAGLRPYGLDIASNGAFAAVANIGRGGGDADTVSVIDLKAKPPRVVNTVTVGQTPEGIKLSPDGSVVAVVVMNGSNKPKDSPFFSDAGKLVLLRVSGTDLSRLAEAPIGHWSQGAAFSPDGKRVFVGNMVEKDIQVFSLDGGTLRDTGVRIAVKGGPAAIRTADK